MKTTKTGRGPVLTIRRAGDRGHADHGWLKTWFTFSFADYHDPAHMEFRSLRVMNDDTVAPGEGFPPHSHRDMEIITYVLDGAVAHKDSMGHEETLRAGEVQRMTAGRGVVHSERNPSKSEPLHLYQVWIHPDRPGLEPGYEQKLFPESEKRGRLRVIVSPDGRDGSLRIHQDAILHAAVLDAGQSVTHELKPARHAWIQVARGAIKLNGEALREGDGASASGGGTLTIEAAKAAEILLFDLA